MNKKINSKRINNNNVNVKENFRINDVGTFFKGGYNSQINDAISSPFEKSNNFFKGESNSQINDAIRSPFEKSDNFLEGDYNSQINAPFESAYEKTVDAITNIANATPDAIKLGYSKTADALESAYDYIQDNGKIEKVFGNSYTFNGRDSAEDDIQKDNYTLFHRFLYGGLCSGAIVIPTNAFKIILTLIFPPLGTLLEIIGDALLDYFPYITWDTLMKIFQFENINKIIYTLVLTSMFYVPGLVYALAQLTKPNAGQRGTLQCDPDTGNCEEITKKPVPVK